MKKKSNYIKLHLKIPREDFFQAHWNTDRALAAAAQNAVWSF